MAVWIDDAEGSVRLRNSAMVLIPYGTRHLTWENVVTPTTWWRLWASNPAYRSLVPTDGNWLTIVHPDTTVVSSSCGPNRSN